MEQLKTKLEEIKNIIVKDLMNSCDNDVYGTLLNAFNRYQEDETDGVDYIFDADNKDDIVCCLNGGMTINELSRIMRFRDNVSKCYYMYNCTYKIPKVLPKAEVKHIILSNLDEILDCVLKYPFVEEYRYIYTQYITNTLGYE